MARVRSISKCLFWSAAATLSLGCSSDSGKGSGPVGSSSNDTTSVNPTVTPSTTAPTPSNPGGTNVSPVSPTNSVTPSGATGPTGTPQPSGMTGPGATGATGGTAGTGATGATGGTAGTGATGGTAGTGATGGTGGTGGTETDETSTAGEPDAGSTTDDQETDDTTGEPGTSDDTTDGMGNDTTDGEMTDDMDPGSDSGMSEGCGKDPTIPSSAYNNGQPIAITVGGQQRRYILRVPDNYDNTKPYKLIIAWHQLDGNDVQMYANDYYHLLPLSGGNAIFAAPNGQKMGGPVCTGMGNGEAGCGWPNPNGADLALGDAVVNELKSNFCIDNNRIFATGWSYGGSMSYEHACERALGGSKDGVEGYIRGIAIYSANQLSGRCTPSTPVAFYGSHGVDDTVLRYSPGVSLAENFANANGCNWQTPPQAGGNHMCTDIAGCPEEYPVQFCSFPGGHTPDPSDGGGGSWQYQRVWDFFNQF